MNKVRMFKVEFVQPSFKMPIKLKITDMMNKVFIKVNINNDTKIELKAVQILHNIRIDCCAYSYEKVADRNVFYLMSFNIYTELK